jgi:hypothetical protein
MDNDVKDEYEYDELQLDTHADTSCRLCKHAYSSKGIQSLIESVMNSTSLGMNVLAMSELLTELLNTYFNEDDTNIIEFDAFADDQHEGNYDTDKQQIIFTIEECHNHLTHVSPVLLKYDMILKARILLKEYMNYAIQINKNNNIKNLNNNNTKLIHSIINTIIKSCNESITINSKMDTTEDD